MQKIKPLLDQANNELKKNSSALPTAAGRTDERSAPPDSVREPAGEFSGDGELDHVDAVNQLFAEFEFAYHNQFHKAYASPEDLTIAKKYWLSSLEHLPPRHIVQAGKRVIRSSGYLPSIAIVLQACEQGYELFGLPAPRQAYLEACAAPSPKRQQQWSHEAVYHAGKAAGWYMLANEPEARAFPVFEYHYGWYCKRVMQGEDLHIDAPPPLPDKIEKPLGKKETQARLAKLRKDLGL